VARALNSLGNVAYELGDQSIAKHFYQQSLNLSREIGDQWGMAGSVKSGETRRASAETLAARQNEKERLLEEIEAKRKAGDEIGIAAGLFDLGVLNFQMQEYDSARNHFTDALKHYNDIDDTTGVIMAFQWLGSVSSALDEHDDASKFLRKALNAALRVENKALAQQAMLGIARLYIITEHRGEALEILGFLLSYPELNESVEDDAEQLVFDLEESLSPEVVAHYWELGKAHDFKSITATLLDSD